MSDTVAMQLDLPKLHERAMRGIVSGPRGVVFSDQLAPALLCSCLCFVPARQGKRQLACLFIICMLPPEQHFMVFLACPLLPACFVHVLMSHIMSHRSWHNELLLVAC